ncbi:MAG: hypothetical protein QNJ36_04510 [Calothrix sp. MO_167.B42]|nr:hypothetical protein [Calothrix sp. MO_167.B42]
MEAPENLDLMWEKTFGGHVGIYKPRKKVRFTPTLMRNLAISKMVDVKLISAEFQENTFWFEPLVWLLFDSVSNIEFIGVYATDTDNEDISDNSSKLDICPSFCIRKSSWSKSEDIYNLQHADDKKKYILGENQIYSNVFFIDSTHLPEIEKIISEAIHLTKNGLLLEENIQSRLACTEITINVSDGRFYLNFSYKPHLLTNSALEEWIIKLRNSIDNLPLDIGYLPDDKFTMSYELSLFDKISMFDKF